MTEDELKQQLAAAEEQLAKIGNLRRLLAEFRDKRRAEIRAAHWMSEWNKGYMGAMETVFDLLDKYGYKEEE